MTMVIAPLKKKSEAQAEVKAEKAHRTAEKAAEREAEAEADKAHREAAKKTATPKKPRRRSENLDPDMEA
jgi:translation initiation factor IF-3